MWAGSRAPLRPPWAVWVRLRDAAAGEPGGSGPCRPRGAWSRGPARRRRPRARLWAVRGSAACGFSASASDGQGQGECPLRACGAVPLEGADLSGKALTANGVQGKAPGRPGRRACGAPGRARRGGGGTRAAAVLPEPARPARAPRPGCLRARQWSQARRTPACRAGSGRWRSGGRRTGRRRAARSRAGAAECDGTVWRRSALEGVRGWGCAGEGAASGGGGSGCRARRAGSPPVARNGARSALDRAW